jgi:hypothetical protein
MSRAIEWEFVQLDELLDEELDDVELLDDDVLVW